MAGKKELEAKLKKLQDMDNKGDMADEIAKVNAQLVALEGGGTAGSDDEFLGTDITQEDYDKSSSMFAVAGEFPAVFGRPSKYVKDGVEKNSFVFPYEIPAPGYEAPFSASGLLWAGRDAKSAWKLKEYLEALGVATSLDKNGMIQFRSADVEGKIAKVAYVVEGTYMGEDPNTGDMVEMKSTIAKATTVLPISAKTENLDV